MTNPRNPKGSSSLIRSPYQVQENSFGFTFTTDNLTRYQVVFESNAKDLPHTAFGENCVTIPIVALSGYVNASAEAFSRQGDPKIEVTITTQLERLFATNPLVVVNYSCDLDEELERHRYLTFGRWYNTHLKPMGIDRVSHTNQSERVYAAALYRKDNPHKEEIEAFFQEIFLGK